MAKAKQVSPIPGTSTLNMGKPGTGKTTSIKTLADQGLEVFCIFTEPNYSVLVNDLRIKYRYISPTKLAWADVAKNYDIVNTQLSEEMKKLPGMNKSEYRQFFDVLSACNNFIDERTGEEYGDVMEWGTDRVLVLDSLTGVVKMIRGLAVGAKPALTWPEFDTVQKNIQQFIDLLCYGLRCHFIVNAHIEISRDELSGGNVIMASTIGNKLSPVIHVPFDNAILSLREGDQFAWTVGGADAMTKAIHFPLTDNYPQDYKRIVDDWKDKGGIIE